jgi:hypothetical protein
MASPGPTLSDEESPGTTGRLSARSDQGDIGFLVLADQGRLEFAPVDEADRYLLALSMTGAVRI